MKLIVNNSQLKKYNLGKPFQLSKDQLNGQFFSGGSLFEIEIDDAHNKIIHRAKMAQKGLRFNGGSIASAFNKIGKDINKSVKNTNNEINKSIKNTNKSIVKTENQTGAVIVKTANDVDKWAKKVDLGGYVEDIKSAVPQSTLTTILTSALVAGAAASGNPMLIAAAPVLAASATSAFYKADFSKNLNGQGEAVGVAALKTGFTEGRKAYNESNKTEGGSINPFLIHEKQKRPIGRPRKQQSMNDLHMIGGSFKPVGENYYGSGFKASGGSFKPSGSGFKASGSGLIKGSNAAKQWGERMREARMGYK